MATRLDARTAQLGRIAPQGDEVRPTGCLAFYLRQLACRELAAINPSLAKSAAAGRGEAKLEQRARYRLRRDARIIGTQMRLAARRGRARKPPSSFLMASLPPNDLQSGATRARTTLAAPSFNIGRARADGRLVLN